jgi:cell wall assembly regulator SMI1
MGESEQADVPLLSFELLDQLRLRLVEQRAPVVDLLTPGLDDRELDTVLQDIGLRPSTEARIWWAWSGGVAPSAVQFSNERSIGPGQEFLEPAEALALYKQTRGIAQEMADDAAAFAPNTERATVDWWWQPGWLPITTNGAGTTIACDCSVSEGEPSPMHAVHWGARENFYEPSAQSFGQTVQWWIDALDAGAWRYQADSGRWVYKWKLVDRDRQLSGLV